MEISEFARQLLFTDDLNAKLWSPTTGFSDNNANLEWKQPAFPGRPARLLPNRQKRQKFPSLASMEKDTAVCGAVLHFFANHELLAIEIMALTLLKFPDLDAQFRLSLVQTIQDEQKHMKLYMNRMADFEVNFGDIGVSDFFWKCCKDHSRPDQFLAAVSLSFEQANLDYCVYFRNAFEQMGDQSSAQILQQVYEDEINHVKNGVRWILNRKEKRQSIWDYYLLNLDYPLTPQRAKGLVFDEAGREAAGLDVDFIQRLKLFGHSTGKVPNIWSFYPGSEWEYANQPRPKAAQSLQSDLESMLMWLAGPDDVVVVNHEPSQSFLETILAFKSRIPQNYLRSDLKNWGQRSTGSIKSWAITDSIQSELEPLIDCSPDWQKQRIRDISDEFAYGFHRKRSVELESMLSDKMSHPSLVFALGTIGNASTPGQEAFNYPMLAKSVFSSSGNGLFRFESAREFENCKYRNDHDILFEPWFNRVVDLSFLYDCDAAGNYFNQAITRFNTSARGTYKSHIVGNFAKGLSPKILRMLFQKNNNKSLISEVQNQIRELLPHIWPNYRGPVGVDAMVIEKDGDYLLRPVVEINFRHTMGHYSHLFRKLLAPGKMGLFSIHTRKNKPKEIPDHFATVKSCSIVKNKLIDGELILNDSYNAKTFEAVLSVLPS